MSWVIRLFTKFSNLVLSIFEFVVSIFLFVFYIILIVYVILALAISLSCCSAAYTSAYYCDSKAMASCLASSRMETGEEADNVYDFCFKSHCQEHGF